MVVEPIGPGREVDRERGHGKADPDDERHAGARSVGQARGLLWGPPGDPVLRSDPPSTLVQEPFPVTGPASVGIERGTGAPSRSTGTQGAVGAVLLVLALGLALRLIIAQWSPAPVSGWT